jgi:hypothetical protein
MYDEAIELLFRERPMHFYGYVLNFGTNNKKTKTKKTRQTKT